jgi:Spy/CpxP family protein refolding chaperone
MQMSLSSRELRKLALVTAAACVLCASMVVGARASASAPATSKSSTATTSHAKAATSEGRTEVNERLEKMTDHLSLTDDQVTKVREILQYRSAQLSELHAKYKGRLDTPENKATQEKARQELHAKIEAKLAHVLTAGQMAEYRKMGTERTKKTSAKVAEESGSQK